MKATAQQSYMAYNALCAVLEHNDIDYRSNKQKLCVTCRVCCKDIEPDFVFLIDPPKMLATLHVPIPVIIHPDNLSDLSVGLCIINNTLTDVQFCLDITRRRITFRLTSSFYNSRLHPPVFEYMLSAAADAVDEYYPKILLLSAA